MIPNPTRTSHTLGIASVAVSAAAFSSLGIFGRGLAQEGFSTSATLFVRFGLSAFFLAFFLIGQKRFVIQRSDVVKLLCLGVFGYTVKSALFLISLKKIPIAIATLLLFLNPSIVLLIRSIRAKALPNRIEFFSLVLLLIGCGLLIIPGNNFEYHYDWIGVFCGLGAATWYAFYIIISEQILKKTEPLISTALVSTGAAIVFFLWGVFTESLQFPHSKLAWEHAFGISILATVIPISLFFYGIRILGSVRASIVSTFEPVFAAIVGFLLLGDTYSPIQIVGALAVIVAIFVPNILNALLNRTQHLRAEQ